MLKNSVEIQTEEAKLLVAAIQIMETALLIVDKLHYNKVGIHLSHAIELARIEKDVEAKSIKTISDFSSPFLISGSVNY